MECLAVVPGVRTKAQGWIRDEPTGPAEASGRVIGVSIAGKNGWEGLLIRFPMTAGRLLMVLFYPRSETAEDCSPCKKLEIRGTPGNVMHLLCRHLLLCPLCLRVPSG